MKRRLLIENVTTFIVSFIGFMTIALFFLMLAFIISQAQSYLSIDFFLPSDTNQMGTLIVTTLLLVVLSLVLSVPVALLVAVYVVEFIPSKNFFAIFQQFMGVLASLPAIIFGLFGMLFFVQLLGLGISLVSGALTMMLILLPILIQGFCTALKSVPTSVRHASFGVGASRVQTIMKVVIPRAMPRIVSVILLAVGRIVGESAALIFTMGTFVRLPMNAQTGSLSIFEAGTTLTVRAFIEIQEMGRLGFASAIGTVILGIIFIFHMVAGWFNRQSDE